MSLDKGNEAPWDLFTFSGYNTTVWSQDSTPGNFTEGTHSITSMSHNVGGSDTSILTREINFDVPKKFKFDIKTDFGNDSRLRFYIDGVIYQYLDSDTPTNGSFITYETPLLPVGDHEFKWEVRKYGWNDGQIWLDNLGFTCENMVGIDCGWEDMSLDKGNEAPWDLFTFSGYNTTAWNQDSTPGNFTEGTHSITSMSHNIGGSDISVLSKEIYFNAPQKLKFLYKTDFGSNSWARFTIDSNGSDTLTPSNSFIPYETGLLPIGTYTFKWEVRKYGWNNGQIWLDGLELIN